MPPAGEWRAWYVRGGRGSGKTRTGAETLARWILDNEPGEWAVIAPTYGDARDTCIEGKRSGLIRVLGSAVENWNRSLGELHVANGAQVFIDGADDGALRIQGKNLMGAWCDEVGLWRQWATAWDESLRFAVREDPARIIATGTPKGRLGLPARFLADDSIPTTLLRTIDNAANLSDAALADLMRQYEGTRLGRQELEGELLDDVEGALWQWAQIEALRVGEAPELQRVVVAVDPAITGNAGSDETGIVGAGTGVPSVIDPNPDAYVLADGSLRASPNRWAEAAVALYRELEADYIVAEANQGGEMVRLTLATVDPNVPVRLVHASRGKRTRAEPVAALYEQGRVHHVGTLPDLETQLTGWTPEDPNSPDRLDALVWALTDLMLASNGHVGKAQAGVPSITADLDTLTW